MSGGVGCLVFPLTFAPSTKRCYTKLGSTHKKRKVDDMYCISAEDISVSLIFWKKIVFVINVALKHLIRKYDKASNFLFVSCRNEKKMFYAFHSVMYKMSDLI